MIINDISNEVLLFANMLCTILPLVLQDHGMDLPTNIIVQLLCSMLDSRLLLKYVLCVLIKIFRCKCFYYTQILEMKFKLQTESWLKKRYTNVQNHEYYDTSCVPQLNNPSGYHSLIVPYFSISFPVTCEPCYFIKEIQIPLGKYGQVCILICVPS